LHKWKDSGELVLISWKEPGFVPGTTQKIQKYVHPERVCQRCGLKERRIFAENRDGTKAAVGWERIGSEAQNPSTN
jgi:hypothetical protein